MEIIICKMILVRFLI